MIPANLGVINCQDDRASDGIPNGVEIPGETCGIVDAFKHLTGATENEAWTKIIQADIPIGAHIDDQHGENGCGYNHLVATSPKSVFAPEAIPAKDRLARVRDFGGTIATYRGAHKPIYAIVNERKGYSFDPDAAVKSNLGVFAFDQWAAEIFGKRLGLNGPTFATHLLNVYKATTTKLSGINYFILIS